MSSVWRIHYALGLGLSAGILGGLVSYEAARTSNPSKVIRAAEIAGAAVASIGSAFVFVALVGYGVYIGVRSARDR